MHVFTVPVKLQNIQSKHNFLFPKEIRTDYTYVLNPSLLEIYSKFHPRRVHGCQGRGGV